MIDIRTTVYISYSHQDQEWLAKIVSLLAPLGKNIHLWSDTEIMPGADWKREIDNALDAAEIVILLVSSSYLSSAFIREIEIPRIIEKAKSGEPVIIPIIINSSMLGESAVSRFQSLNPLSEPLNEIPKSKSNKYLEKLKDIIIHQLDKTSDYAIRPNTKVDTPDLHANIFFKAESNLKVKGEIK